MQEDTFRWVIAGGVGVAVLCIVAIAVVAIMMYRATEKMQRKISALVDRVVPLVATLQRLGNENGPKFSAIATRTREIADNARDISVVAKDQAHRFAEIGRDVADRTKAQVARVDAVVDVTVDQVQHAGTNVKDAVLKPVREASGVIAGLKAAVSTYAQGKKAGVNHITQDEEMFI
jgi:predicted secreted protein